MEEPFTIIKTTIMIMETVLVILKLNLLTFVAADKDPASEWSVNEGHSGNQNDGK